MSARARWRALFCGLMGQRGATVQSRNDRLDGILNGIDMDDWNPETGASRAAGDGWEQEVEDVHKGHMRAHAVGAKGLRCGGRGAAAVQHERR